MKSLHSLWIILALLGVAQPGFIQMAAQQRSGDYAVLFTEPGSTGDTAEQNNSSPPLRYQPNNEVTRYENVIYGMISGMALLMDIYRPGRANGTGILFIPGSAFGLWPGYQKVYNQPPLKDDYFLDTAYGGKWMQALVARGFTLFVINHRFAPRFHYPDIFYDCQRAVRFIRNNAGRFGINGYKLGAMGHSSGAYLSLLLGQRDTVIADATNVTDRVSSKVQAVTALAGLYNLADFNAKSDTGMQRALTLVALQNYMGRLPDYQEADFILSGLYAQASPIMQVAADNAPTLLYHAPDDPYIPFRQAVALYQQLTAKKVPCLLVEKAGQGHEPQPDMNQVADWFLKYLNKEHR